MSFLYILYLLLAITITLGGMVVLIKSDRTFAGFLFLIGGILLFTYYGVRWFQSNSLTPTKYSSKTWPPVINTCPDFLTLNARNVGGKQQRVCIDLDGVSNSGMRKFTDPVQINNENYIFNLHDNLKGAARLKAICQECRNKRVTWEGVYDGVSCSADAIPNARGSVDTRRSCK